MNVLSRLTRPQRSSRPASVQLAAHGRPHAGKSMLRHAVTEHTPLRTLPSSELQFGAAEDPRDYNARARIRRQNLTIYRNNGFPATEELEPWSIELCKQGETLVRLTSLDMIGQILSGALPDSDPEIQRLYMQHVDVLQRAHVLWTVLALPARDGSSHDVERWQDDLRRALVYLHTAQRGRPEMNTVSVAIVLTKLDTLFESAEEARDHLTDDEILEAVQPLVTGLRGSRSILSAACFPVSALGFGRAVPLATTAESSSRGGIAGLDEGEQEWILGEDMYPEPFNVLGLVVWSIMAGLANTEVDSHRADEFRTLYQQLRSDLEQLDAWMVPVKE
jgi:hypothetical protein